VCGHLGRGTRTGRPVLQCREDDRDLLDREAGAAYSGMLQRAGMPPDEGEVGKTKKEQGMTEAEWLACTSYKLMLEVLLDKASERNLRLFVCACCRQVWGALPTEDCRRVVEVSERYADGLATKKELQQARLAARKSVLKRDRRYNAPAFWQVADPCSFIAWCTARDTIGAGVQEAAEAAGSYLNVSGWRKCDQGQPAPFPDPHKVAEILREVFGNPFRSASLSRSVLAWNGGTVVKLARTIYDEWAFDRLPVLADALEEAGCTNADILAHCRQPGPHTRGCWVIDVLLGKE
jgi:hypothetical protein